MGLVNISFKSDLHVHTLMSGHAFNTMNECIAKASELMLDYLGIADHGPSMEGAPHLGYFEVFSRIPKQINDIKMLYGCEANIINVDGEIDITDELSEHLNYVMAGLHERTPYNEMSIIKNTSAIINAMKRGKINIITHLYRKNFPVDIHDAVYCAKETNIILEINKSVLLSALINKDHRLIANLNRMIELIIETGTRCIVGSDAHYTSEIGISKQEWDIMSANYNLSNIETSNNDIKLLENLWNSKKQKEMFYA